MHQNKVAQRAWCLVGIMRSGLIAALWLAMVAISTAVAHAAAFPDRPIRLIVPFPPGGGADIIARLVGQRLSATLGQAVVVDNRPGANGNIGSDVVAKSAPDGYTLLMNTIGLVFSQSIYQKLPFNVLKDFSPVILVAGTPYILVVRPSLHINSVADLIAVAKAKPGQINCATVGIGSPFQMSAELFKSLAKVDVTNIPFQGGGPAMLSLVSGETDITFANLLAVQSFINSGQLQVLAVTSDKRSPIMPNVPTMAESGLPGYELNGWFGIWAPAGTPKPIIDALNREIAKVLDDAEVRSRLEKDGAAINGGSPEDFERYVKSEYAKWDKIIKAADIHAD